MHREREAIPPEVRKGKRVLKYRTSTSLSGRGGDHEGRVIAYYRDVAPR